MHAFDLERLAGNRIVVRRAVREGADAHARRHRPHPRRRHAGHRRRETRGGDRRRHGRREFRDFIDDHVDCAGERVLRTDGRSQDEQEARLEDRSVDTVRAGRRYRDAPERHCPGRGVVRADWRRRADGAADRSLPEAAAAEGGRAPGVPHRAAPRASRSSRRCSALSRGAWLPRARRQGRMDGDRPLVPRRRHARRGFDRGGRPSLRVRPPAGPVPAAARPISRRPIRGSRGIGSSGWR